MSLISVSAWHRGRERKRLKDAEDAKAAFEMREPSNERPAELDNLPPRRRHKHHVVVNSKDSVHVHHFDQILRNVESIELVSAIIPRGQLRLNEYNNVLPITINGDKHVIETKMGDYTNVLYLLIEINYQLRQILPDGVYILFLYDLMKTKVVIVASKTLTVEIPFINHRNTIAQGLGFHATDTVVINQPLTTASAGTPNYERDVGAISASITYLHDRLLTDNIINNYPVSLYTNPVAPIFPLDAATNVPDIVGSEWNVVTAPNRANLSFQLYIDISVDEIKYWDNSSQIARIFISDDEEQVEYRPKATDIHRKMREEMKDFDRLTIRLDAIGGLEKHPYKLNGLPYSLQFEVITLDN